MTVLEIGEIEIVTELEEIEDLPPGGRCHLLDRNNHSMPLCRKGNNESGVWVDSEGAAPGAARCPSCKQTRCPECREIYLGMKKDHS